MTFFERVSSLDDRALSKTGVKLLEWIASRQRSCMTCNGRDMRKVAQINRHDALHALINAGFVKTTPTALASYGEHDLKLTNKGWDFVGNKPIWL
jgi:hypothetical protein